MLNFSLKTRFAIVMSIGALALVKGMGLVTLRLVQGEVLATLSSQQLAIAARAADDLDARLRLAMDTLVAGATDVPLAALDTPQELRSFATDHAALLKLFDELVVIDMGGAVVADYPAQPGRIGLDVRARGYFIRVMQSGQPIISEPFKGKVSGLPVVSVVTPILDREAKVVGMLLGVLQLQKANLLGQLSSARLGETGYFEVTTGPPDPVYLVHPDRARIMQRAPVASSAPAHGAQGGEGGVELTTSSDGSEALVGRRRLMATDWVLTAVLPGKEAFAAIENARRHTYQIAILSALIVLPLVWLLAWVFLHPLTMLRRRVNDLIAGRESNGPRVAGRRDEVGDVARAFEALLEQRRIADAQRIAAESERRQLADILEDSRDYVAKTDVRGKVTYANVSGRHAVGVAADADLGCTTIDDYFPPWAVERIRREGIPVALKEGTWLGETALRGKDGIEIPVDHMLVAHRDAAGTIDYFASVMHDTSEAKAATAAVRASGARMLALADALPVLVAFIDADERYVFINTRYEDFVGCARDEVLGKTIREIGGEAAYAAFAPHLERVKRGETVVIERELERRGRHFHLQSRMIPQADEQGTFIGFHVIHDDVTDHVAEQRRLSHLARVDVLTGALNRAGFAVALDEAMTHCTQAVATMALLYLDIDRFKSVNDMHGHATGDLLLRAFAARLGGAVRTADVVARLGGDEFVVVAQNLRGSDDARGVAEKILRMMQTPFVLDGVTLPVTTSIGVAVYDGGAMTAEALTASADQALYQAKHAGRNRFALAPPPACEAGSKAPIPQEV